MKPIKKKMKATELKLGDWVLYKNKPSKVHSIDPPSIYVEGNDEVWGALEDDGDLMPIPLTEEILEKNGFVHHKDQEDDFWCIPNQYFGIDVKDGSLVWVNSKKILSVHQLQHILWTLGMNDDLKI